MTPGVKDYAELCLKAGGRTRNVIMVMMIACVLGFGALWSTSTLSWWSGQIEDLDGKVRTAIRDSMELSEIDVRIRQLRTEIDTLQKMDSRQASQWRSKEQAIPVPFSVKDKTASKRVSEGGEEEPGTLVGSTLDKKTQELEDMRSAQADLEGRVNGHRQQLGRWSATRDQLRSLRTQQAVIVRIPFFGISLHINDIGLMGGFAFIVLLLWLAASLHSERRTLALAFRKVGEEDRMVLYDLVATGQVLDPREPHETPPDRPTRLRTIRSVLDRVPRLLVVLPAAIQTLTVLLYAGALLRGPETVFGFPFPAESTRQNLTATLALSVLLLLPIVALTFRCWQAMEGLDEIWEKARAQLESAGGKSEERKE